ncbi:PREDICTED: transcription factor mef2A-like [Nicrophorus vespilloides]|uniref:Transcription factor mef2A-like n=1 Tax=Nicrophorus vespilloides TaxID=110193 RepID=A0ABM1M7N9_NICVS|nr:PREDICTED: transcription factor mef2A-like [Nicrophorus vespilloides]
MMMMDVGMYGHGHHHTQHGNVYNSSDGNFYNYANEAASCSQTPQITSTQYGYHYEDGAATSYNYNQDASETSSSPYYPHQTIPQENPIISTDTGLSYTNLDYSNSNSSSAMYPPMPIYPPETYQRTHDSMLRHHDELDYIHENKYAPHQLDHDPYQSCMEYPHHRGFKEESPQPPPQQQQQQQHHQQHQHHRPQVLHQMQQTAPQPQPVLPTYKWMQVKRNVPKPAGQ